MGKIEWNGVVRNGVEMESSFGHQRWDGLFFSFTAQRETDWAWMDASTVRALHAPHPLLGRVKL